MPEGCTGQHVAPEEGHSNEASRDPKQSRHRTIGLALAGLAASGVALASTPNVPGAVTGPHVYVGYHNAAVFLPYKPNMTTVGTLSLPAGGYTVTAKAWVQSQAGLGNSAAYCKLTLGSNADQAQADAQDGNGDVARQPVRNASLYLTLTGSISSGNTVSFGWDPSNCRFSSSRSRWRSVTSTSTTVVSCAAVCSALTMFSAMTSRIRGIFTV